MIKKEKTSKRPSKPKTVASRDLPGVYRATNLSRLLPDPLQRDFAEVVLEMIRSEEFRNHFWVDPAGTLEAAGLSPDPRVIDALVKSERPVLDRVMADMHKTFERVPTLVAGEPGRTAVFPLVAGALVLGAAVGALATEVAHHHFTLSSDLPISRVGEESE